MKALLVALTLIAAAIGGAGAAALALERRVAALAPGGVEVATFDYNPLTGRLALANVHARDAAGRELFRADNVVATVNPLRLLTRPLTLSRARVEAPVLTLRAGAGLDLAELAAGLGAAPAAATGLPVRIDDLVIAGGRLVVEGVSDSGAALVIRDLDVRLSRLTTAAAESSDVAFAVKMAAYGATVYLTGQPRGDGYLLHVRAHGLDVPALVHDLGPGPLDAIQRGRGNLDIGLLLIGGRSLASGHARVTDAVVRLPVEGRPRLRAAAVSVALDRLDLVSGTGRISRLDLTAPTLALPAATAATTLAALMDPLRGRAELLLRRVQVADGTLVLQGPRPVRLQGLQIAAHAPERRGDGAWLVTARAGLDGGAEAALDGIVARDLRGLDVIARLQRVAVAPWRALLGAPPVADARLSFDGRLRVVAGGGEGAAVTLAGQAMLADMGGSAREALSAVTTTVGGTASAGTTLDRLFGALENPPPTVEQPLQ